MPARCDSDATDALIEGDPAALSVLRGHVCGTAERFDARLLTRDQAVTALHEWNAIAHAALAACALASARLADCGPPPSAGAKDAADFVAKKTGTTAAKARERIETGHGMRANDKTRARAAAGRLSPDQAAAITDALKADPTAEDKLLSVAEEASLGELRDECAKTKAAVIDVAEQERRIHAGRSIRRYHDREGAEHLHAVGTKRDMALIDQALKPLIDKRFTLARTEGVREPFEAYAFDALVDMARNSLDETPRGSTKRKNPVRNLTVLRVDFEALIRGHVESDETCEIAGLGPIAVETARDLLGESILKLVITKGVDVLNVTHLGRGPNMAQKIALLWQQFECTRLGCNNTGRLEYDHRDGVEYRKTKHTRLDETDPLCDREHKLKTYKGWALVAGKGKREMVPPDDPRHPRFQRERPPP